MILGCSFKDFCEGYLLSYLIERFLIGRDSKLHGEPRLVIPWKFYSDEMHREKVLAPSKPTPNCFYSSILERKQLVERNNLNNYLTNGF